MIYGITVWGNGSGISRVLKLQKSAIRILTSSPYDAHCKPLFKSEGIMTVINMYILRCLLNIKTNFNHYASASTVHNYSTRNNYQLIEPQVRLSKSKNWYNSIAIALFNRLPQETFNLTCNKFKKIAQKWLVTNPFYSIDEYFQMEQINIL